MDFNFKTYQIVKLKIIITITMSIMDCKKFNEDYLNSNANSQVKSASILMKNINNNSKCIDQSTNIGDTFRYVKNFNESDLAIFLKKL